MGAKGAKIRIIYHKDFFPKDYSEEQIKKARNCEPFYIIINNLFILRMQQNVSLG